MHIDGRRHIRDSLSELARQLEYEDKGSTLYALLLCINN